MRALPHRVSQRSAVAAVAFLLLAIAAPLPAATEATSLPVRTLLASMAGDGDSAAGVSSNPALSASGMAIAFDSTAPDLPVADGNGAIRDVVLLDARRGEARLVSAAPGGAGADGGSSDPALSADGRRVAFTSAATNLVAGDSNRVHDVYVRDGGAPVALVSVGIGGAPANGPSTQPDISADGSRVVFTSGASNLVSGDANGRHDVFVRDLAAGVTRMVSGGRTGASRAPAISGDGRFVSFFTSDPRIARGDRNRLADVVVRDLRTGDAELVSVSGAERQQDRSVLQPFTQVSDLSEDGRYVVFDSDATNLVRNDRNRDTDVFLRDRRRGTTDRVSVSSSRVEGDNDSFNPTLTPDGRFVAFTSFAENLAPGTGARADVFVRDRRLRATSAVSMTATGRRRAPELVRQLLQRAALSADGRLGAFTSTAGNLVARDSNRLEDVFVRRLDAPRTVRAAMARRASRTRRPTVRLTGDDPRADRFLCRVDGGRAFLCRSGTHRLPPVGEGRHALSVRAGGPGMLFERRATKLAFSVDRGRPVIRVREPRSAFRVVRGTASDRLSALRRIEVSITFFGRGGCRGLQDGRFVVRSCATQVFVPVAPRRSWRLRLPSRVVGPVRITARAVDTAGNRSRTSDVRTVVLP